LPEKKKKKLGKRKRERMLARKAKGRVQASDKAWQFVLVTVLIWLVLNYTVPGS
jgi:hypothetical protein